ncbi:MAG: hypothetical protein GY745_22535 [Actinomycetia bacterium]|nr:hypothetical protein [Actinomycetes bacterium]
MEVRDLFDHLQARGVPERSDRYCQAVDAASKGAVRLVNNIPLATREDFRWHFGQYQRLAESVASRGVISLREVADTAAGGVGDHDGSAPDFPGITIGDDGNLLWFGEGRHRVAIAQWLSISPIPVSLSGVNRHWLRETVSRGSGPLEAIEARLQAADLSDQDPQRDRAEQWLVSLDRIDDLPEVRPDPLGINDQVSRAMRAHRAGALDDALAIWEELGDPVGMPPHVNVLAASTASALGALEEGRSRVSLVADRLERAGEVLDILLAGDPDERTLGHLDRLIGRLERLRARPGR